MRKKKEIKVLDSRFLLLIVLHIGYFSYCSYGDGIILSSYESIFKRYKVNQHIFQTRQNHEQYIKMEL